MPKVITIKDEYVDERNMMQYKPLATITIEHSLLSISKWEMKYHRPFLNSEKTPAETLDYICMMIIDSNPNPFNIQILSKLSRDNIKEIEEYINDPMTATTFPEDEINKLTGKSKMKKKDIITNELVYYWMAAAGIPFEICERWHINRLLTLIRVYDVKNQPEKKMSKSEIAKRNKALNDARRAKLHTKG